ncbi:MAG: lipoyl synthase [Deltaproteobacteria bacterium RIFCSPLOWO2_12_FULL_60_19]|nr:MAG: lipoyl synthase [Deltaproteobacteria bacterium RIFCSPLOWO2_12_FULL_60_19]
MPRRHPDWVKVRAPGSANYLQLKRILRDRSLHTVCEEARCPNIGECWAHNTATFLILGDICTRGCRFCAIGKGKPVLLDPEEPRNVALSVKDLGLQHIVVTSVDRDDLPDGGSAHFAKTVFWIKSLNPGIRVEVLIPDFKGDESAVETVVRSGIDVLNHNVETVPRLYKKVRPGSVYQRSLDVLKAAKSIRAEVLTKSGLMLGVGEAMDEVMATLRDLREMKCDIVTIGQYLQPSTDQLPVERYVTPDEFQQLKADAQQLGFRHVESGPLVRSSYHAWSHVN